MRIGVSSRIVRMLPFGFLLKAYPGGAGFNSYRLVSATQMFRTTIFHTQSLPHLIYLYSPPYPLL